MSLVLKDDKNKDFKKLNYILTMFYYRAIISYGMVPSVLPVQSGFSNMG